MTRPGQTLTAITVVLTLALEPNSLSAQESSEDEDAPTEIVEITGEGASLHERPPGRTRRTAREAASTPGVGDDAIAATQTDAAVARLPAGRSELIVWGALPAETRLYVDGMPVPRLLHVGGARSILPTSAIGSVEVVPGGAGARYGRGLGGLVSIETASPSEQRRSLIASLDPLAVSVAGHTKLAPETSARLGVRRGLLTETITPLVADDASQLVPLPQTWDYHSRVDHVLANADRLRVTAIGSGDRLTRSIPSRMPTDQFSETRDETFHRIGLTLGRDGADATFSDMSAWVGYDDSVVRQTFGDVEAFEDSQVVSGGLLLAAERWPHERVRVRYGLDLEARQTRMERDGAIALPAREGDIGTFGQPPGNRINVDRWTSFDAFVAGYASTWFDAGDVSVEPGLRIEPVLRVGDRVLPVRPTEPEVGTNQLEVLLEPRLRVGWRPHAAVSVGAAIGRHHQSPSAADRSPVFGNPILASASATRVVLGTTLAPSKNLRAEVVIFGLLGRGLTARSPLATPPQASLLESTGQARTVGAQVSSQLSHGPFTAGVLLSAMRAERRASASAAWRPFDFDQSVRAQAIGSWKRGRFELGTRAEIASGFPRTPVIDAVFNTESQSFDPIFGAQNGERLPLYFSLSLRASLEGRASFGSYRVWFDVHNATAHNNGEEFVYSSDYASRQLAFGFPILPVVGIELTL